jgi:hypothetical protein
MNEVIRFTAMDPNAASVTHGGAKQYTDTRRLTGSPLAGTVRHVLGSAHV